MKYDFEKMTREDIKKAIKDIDPNILAKDANLRLSLLKRCEDLLKENDLKKEQLKNNPSEVGKVYLHVSNSGATFRVIDEGYGPTIEITMSTFGNLKSTTKIHTDKESLQELSDMFALATTYSYTEEYVHKAENLENRRRAEDSALEKLFTDKK